MARIAVAALLLLCSLPTADTVRVTARRLAKQGSHADLAVADEAAEARGLRERVAAQGSGGLSLLGLDTAVRRKHAEAYLVRKAGQQEMPHVNQVTYAANAEAPPPDSVDQTIAVPPDADGNPYNAPVWANNGAPAANSTR
mmetsp:Transcript_31472/g.80216  ORF Transcript_31472/g.80216 Transcript_31472/m.80216 type:complete len:141 (-) Transcript_31472:66-488(-)